METMSIKFSNKDQQAKVFIKDLKQQVEAYFKETGISKKANASMVIKTIVMFTLTFGSYALILTQGFTPWQMLGLAIVMGIGVAGIGFCVAHDALHGAYSSNQTVNNLLGYSFDVLGASSYLWKITHNVIHHTYTNIQGIDEDLEVSPLLRLSPESDYHAYHKFQHWYGFPTYGLSTLNWAFVKDYQQLLKKDLGPYENIQHPRKEVIKLIAFKLLHYALFVVLPFVVLDLAWWQILIGIVVMHFTAGIILGVVFQLAHVVDGVEHFTFKASDTMDDAWLVHEMKTTANFARSNKLLCWYVGGLNFQIEHHLFPKVCSVHYPQLSPIVERVAKAHNIPYNHNETLLKAIYSHYKQLKQFGDPALVKPSLALN